MSELDQKIKQISDMLSQEGAQESIQRILQSFSGGTPRATQRPTPQTQPQPQPEPDYDDRNDITDEYDPSLGNFNDTGFEQDDIVNKFSNVLGSINTQQDSRVNLLRSVQPFLSTKRQDHCKTCINILRAVDIIKLVSNMNK